VEEEEEGEGLGKNSGAEVDGYLALAAKQNCPSFIIPYWQVT
jgi:hypothetical protein